MTYRLRLVNGKSKRTQQVLNRLQKTILPYDKPVDTTIGYWWIIYADNGKPVAFAGMKQSAQFNDCCFLHRAGVMYEHTGKALQKRLIKARLRKAKHMGFNWAVTDTTKNPASSNSLINCGFKLYEPSKPWGSENTYYWRFRIK
jgi:GNAT superfamily N-acetyltransferase